MKKMRLKKIFMRNVSIKELTEMAINNHITKYDSGFKDAERTIVPLVSDMSKEQLVDYVLNYLAD